MRRAEMGPGCRTAHAPPPPGHAGPPAAARCAPWCAAGASTPARARARASRRTSASGLAAAEGQGTPWGLHVVRELGREGAHRAFAKLVRQRAPAQLPHELAAILPLAAAGGHCPARPDRAAVRARAALRRGTTEHGKCTAITNACPCEDRPRHGMAPHLRQEGQRAQDGPQRIAHVVHADRAHCDAPPA